MKDKDMVRFMRFMNAMENDEIEILQQQKLIEENTAIVEHIFSQVNENTSDITNTLSDMIGGGLKSLGAMAKSGLSKLSDKINPEGFEQSIIRDVIESYQDEFKIIKNKYEKSLMLYTVEFWDDIFDILSIDDSSVSDNFKKIHKANLADLLKQSKQYKDRVIAAIKNVEVEDNGASVNVMSKYKNIQAIMASKHSKEVMNNKEVKDALKHYKKFANDSFKKTFSALVGDLIQTLTIEYMAKKNKKLKSKEKDRYDEGYVSRFELFEDEYRILNEMENK